MSHVIVCFFCCNLVERTKRMRRRACHALSFVYCFVIMQLHKEDDDVRMFSHCCSFALYVVVQCNHNEEDDDYDVLECIIIIIIICCFVAV